MDAVTPEENALAPGMIVPALSAGGQADVPTQLVSASMSHVQGVVAGSGNVQVNNFSTPLSPPTPPPDRVVAGNIPLRPRAFQRRDDASAYEAAGRLAEAIALHEATLGERERVLGGPHPDTLISRNNLASAYEASGRLDEAIPLYEATLEEQERVLGSSHPDTLMLWNNLAFACWAAGRRDDAIPLLQSALAGLERVLGAEHPDTVLVRENLDFARSEAAPPSNSHPGCHLYPGFG